MNRAVAPHDQGALHVGVALVDDLEIRGQGLRIAAWPDEPAMGSQQPLHLAGHLYARGGQHHEVIADPLEVGHQVGGEHDAELVLRHGGHEQLQELPPGERVEAGHRLVQDEQFGPLGHGQGESELGLLAARELAGPLLRVQAELADPAPRHLVIPARVEPPAEPEMIGDRQGRVDRGVLGHEPDLAELSGVV